MWNIFGGKLAWGPEAIVCDDPNFQGRGNPSTGKLNTLKINNYIGIISAQLVLLFQELVK